MTAEQLAQELDLHIDIVRAALLSLKKKGLVETIKKERPRQEDD